MLACFHIFHFLYFTVFRPPLSKGQSLDDGGPGVGIQWVEPMSAIGGKADIRRSLTQYRAYECPLSGVKRTVEARP